MKAFDYEEPRTVEEAVACMAKPGKSRALAGGTDLLVRLKRREWPVDRVVNLKKIAKLRGIAERGDQVVIGALTTIEDLERSPLIRERYPLLNEAVFEMASPQVRTLATVGGNLCNASPAADLAPPLLCLDAVMVIRGRKGQRQLPMREFFAGPGRTVMGPDEILEEIRIPATPVKGVFIKFCTRRAMDLAVVSVACAKVGNEIRVALGSVAPTPIRVPASPEEAMKKATPIDDIRASAEYRREMVRVLVRRALEKVTA